MKVKLSESNTDLSAKLFCNFSGAVAQKVLAATKKKGTLEILMVRSGS
jgi:hypothetical protein